MKISTARRRNLEALIGVCKRYFDTFGFDGEHPLASWARLELEGRGRWLADAGMKVHGAAAACDRLERAMKAGVSICGRVDVRAARARSRMMNRAMAADKARAGA